MAIVQELRRIQKRYGYLPERELEFLALRLRLPLYQVQEVATFFPSFRTEKSLGEPKKVPEVTVHVCRDMVCHLRGGAQVLAGVLAEFAAEIAARRVEVKGVSCLGRCDQAAVACLHRNDPSPDDEEDEHPVVSGGLRPVDVPPQRAPADLSREVQTLLAAGGQKLRSPSREGPSAAPAGGKGREPPELEPGWKIDIYNSPNGERLEPFAAIRKLLREGTDLLKSLEEAGLLGMGGALGRAARKWAAARDAVREARVKGKNLVCYVVCNGDESEPGTFKDRELLRRTSHLVVEGVMLAGLFLGARQAYIYIRHEYGDQIRAARDAITRLQREVPHEAVQSFPLEVFVSPGGYICGEQSALLEVLEDRRAQPRNAPPAIEVNGLFDQPTVVNNVETLAWLPGIVYRGASWYATDRRRFLSVSGDVRLPGVYEVPVKSTLRELIEGCAGGVTQGHILKAVAASGPSGGFLPPRLEGDALRALRERLAITLRDLRVSRPGDVPRLEQFLADRLPEDKPALDVLDLELDGTFFRNLVLL